MAKRASCCPKLLRLGISGPYTSAAALRQVAPSLALAVGRIALAFISAFCSSRYPQKISLGVRTLNPSASHHRYEKMRSDVY